MPASQTAAVWRPVTLELPAGIGHFNWVTPYRNEYLAAGVFRDGGSAREGDAVVLSSSDGLTWQTVLDPQPGAGQHWPFAAVAGDRVVILYQCPGVGGFALAAQTFPGAPTPNYFVGTFVSDDGATWQQAPVPLPDESIKSVSCPFAVGGWGRRYVMVGAAQSVRPSFYQVLGWSSADGLSWTATKVGSDASTRDDGPRNLAGGPAGFVANGTYLGSPETWLTIDGSTWQVIDGLPARTQFGGLTVYAAGRYLLLDSPLLSSPDGVTWSAHASPFNTLSGVSSWSGGFVATGQYAGAPSRTFVATSDTGLDNWTRLALAGVPDWYPYFFTFGDRVLAFGPDGQTTAYELDL